MASVGVPYIVHDVDEALAFYCEQLGFHEDMHASLTRCPIRGVQFCNDIVNGVAGSLTVTSARPSPIDAPQMHPKVRPSAAVTAGRPGWGTGGPAGTQVNSADPS